MELIEGYEILSKDNKGYLNVKYTLKTVPTQEWTRVFNRTNEKITSYSIMDSALIIVTIDLPTFYKNGISEKLAAKINKVDDEVLSDKRKIAIILEDINNDKILDNWMSGMIVLHLRSELSYTEANVFKEDVNPEKYPDYKYYIRNIKESIDLSNY